MKKVLASVIAGTAALCFSATAHAESVRAKQTQLTKATHGSDVSASSRHRRYGFYRHHGFHRHYHRAYNSFAFAPVGLAIGSYDPYYARPARVVTYDPYDDWGPYGGYGYDSFGYNSTPFVSVGFGGYRPHNGGFGPGVSFGFGGPFW